MSDPLAEDSQLMWRLAQYMAAHPEVKIGREWRARIPRPRGAKDVICGTLQELLDELERTCRSPRSAWRDPGKAADLSGERDAQQAGPTPREGRGTQDAGNGPCAPDPAGPG
jgi:hypothetical protein